MQHHSSFILLHELQYAPSFVVTGSRNAMEFLHMFFHRFLRRHLSFAKIASDSCVPVDRMESEAMRSVEAHGAPIALEVRS
ncbi:hypothetical protein PMAYCL1PPCAC_31178, partial [Pristionchus mayeri]